MAWALNEHFVTLFNLNWAPQGLCLHRSLQRHLPGRFTLWIVCVDRHTFDALNGLKLQGVRLINLEDVETPALLSARAERSTAEYCWTITPFTLSWVFDADPSVLRVTYVDADAWLRADPLIALREFTSSGKAIQLTRHAYSPEYDKSALTGVFCVQFMTFVRDRSEAVLRTWQQQCLEWCYDRFEEGRFGDQKYLDAWPSQYPDMVHVLQDEQLMQAPWNASRFPYSSSVLYHFHGLKILGTGRVHLGPYPLPGPTLDYVYEPYLRDLRDSIDLLAKQGIPYPHQAKRPSAYRSARMRGAFIVRHFRGLFGPMTKTF